MHDLVFLTRDGCVNTTTMRARLDEALASLGLPTDYQFIDADALPSTDARAGYGTPTVLYARRDLFGAARATGATRRRRLDGCIRAEFRPLELRFGERLTALAPSK